MQIIINILMSSLIILLVGISFSIIYQVLKFFHVAHAINITFGAYFTFFFSQNLQLSLWFAVPFSIISVAFLNLLLEFFIYRSMRKKNATPLVLLISSLGIYVICQNIISILWQDDIKSFRTADISVGHEFWGAYLTDIQIITICVSLVLFILVNLFINKTMVGRKIIAVSSNEDLSNILGINSESIIVITLFIGTILASVVGILVAADTDMTPTMGFNLLIYGIVAMIIGGVGSSRGLIGGSILLATAQHLSSYYIDSKWIDAATYLILILFLIWKPLGFSGKRLKKVEV